MLDQGQQFLEEGRFEDALACFDACSDPRAIFGRAVALQLLGRLDEAEAAYESVLTAQPANQEILANLIALNVERFDLSRVENYSRRLLDVDPEAAIALRGLIVVAVERRDYELAGRYFSRLRPVGEPSRDAVEYRLSWQVVDRLKDSHGPVTHSH